MIAVYTACRALYLRRPRGWTHPVVTGWLVMSVILLASHTNYALFRQGTAPLVWWLGPSVVAFAVPMYHQRAIILRRWRVLAVLVGTGSLVSVLVSWEWARALQLPAMVRASLLPRSVSTPFAMMIAGEIGGVPGLTATFTAFTGVLGALFAEPLSRLLRLTSPFARGAMLGMGAHAIGTARAFQFGPEEGAVAAATMTLAGVTNVMVAGLILALRR